MRFNFKRIIAMLAAICGCAAVLPLSAGAADGVISVGKSYTVDYATPIENAYPNLAYQPESKLTDGKTASAEYGDKAWLTLYRGTAARVTIDLGAVMAVSEVKVGQLQLKSYGVCCSRYVNVYVSEDGESFAYAGGIKDDKTITSDKKQRVEFACPLENRYKARYVRVEFSSDVFTMVDEISVIGNEDVTNAVTDVDYEDYEVPGYAKPLDGINTICLMYISAGFTQEMIKPYFAYIDTDGNASDTMFDSLIFLGMPANDNADNYLRMADMQNFVQIVMGDDTGLNLNALNSVVGELKGDLGLGDDYKYPVFISMPFPGIFSDAFGEIDGKTVTASNLDGRKKIVDWYIDYVTDEFNSRSFENLDLKGLYWFNEIVQYWISPDEEEIIVHFNESAHEKGYKTLWIPYYSASGIDRLEYLGFDSAVMQSGYAFDGSDETGTPKPESCDDAASTAKRYGMGMEFEVDMNKNNYYGRYAQYVHVAYREGLMTDGIMMMYQVGTNIYQSAVGSASIRGLYELTYKYCSKTYTEHAPVISEGATVTLKTGEYINGKLEVSDEDTPLSGLKIAQMNKPSGLYFSAEGNGFYEIEAYNTEPGTYVASFSVTDGFAESELATVTIIVEPADETSEPESVSNQNGEDETDAPGDDAGSKPWLYAVIAAGAVAALAAITAIVYKRKNKKTNKGAHS